MKGAENEKEGSRMEVDDATLREARVEIQSPKRKVKRVESQETQDHVRETLAIRQEEAEELGLVSSGLSIPRGSCTGATIDAVTKLSDTGR